MAPLGVTCTLKGGSKWSYCALTIWLDPKLVSRQCSTSYSSLNLGKSRISGCRCIVRKGRESTIVRCSQPGKRDKTGCFQNTITHFFRSLNPWIDTIFLLKCNHEKHYYRTQLTNTRGRPTRCPIWFRSYRRTATTMLVVGPMLTWNSGT